MSARARASCRRARQAGARGPGRAASIFHDEAEPFIAWPRPRWRPGWIFEGRFALDLSLRPRRAPRSTSRPAPSAGGRQWPRRRGWRRVRSPTVRWAPGARAWRRVRGHTAPQLPPAFSASCAFPTLSHGEILHSTEPLDPCGSSGITENPQKCPAPTLQGIFLPKSRPRRRLCTLVLVNPWPYSSGQPWSRLSVDPWRRPRAARARRSRGQVQVVRSARSPHTVPIHVC